ncbi:hypothetical protein ON010_g15730 [Phytophthora cinnamomi]|nr:hypothetical protein ON010_g15730 [Phytophthora cinnamomi]
MIFAPRQSGPTRRGHGAAAEGDGLSLHEPPQHPDFIGLGCSPSWKLADPSEASFARRVRPGAGLGVKQTTDKQTVDFGEDPGKFLCPETKKSEMPEKFRSTVGTSYFDDSNMLTPRKVTPSRGRYGPLYDPSDEAELDEDTWDDRGHLDELVKVLIHRLSYDEEEQADTSCHKRRSSAEATQRGVFDYYCSQYDQSARTRYYSASRKENKPICDVPIRLSGYTRTTKIQYGMGGTDAADHVEQFLLNSGDDEAMILLYPLQLTDIQRVEQIINKKILAKLGGVTALGEMTAESVIERVAGMIDASRAEMIAAESRLPSQCGGCLYRGPSRVGESADMSLGAAMTIIAASAKLTPTRAKATRRSDAGVTAQLDEMTPATGGPMTTEIADCTSVPGDRLEKLTEFVRVSVDKPAVPAHLEDIYEPKVLN